MWNQQTASRGTVLTNPTANVIEIGRAKSRGFEFTNGTISNSIIASSSNTSPTYRHYLFDIQMFTHIHLPTEVDFDDGEVLTGGTSGATGVIEDVSTSRSVAVTSISVANPGVVTSTAHGLKDGQQITFSSPNLTVTGISSITNATVFTVRNATDNTFDLYKADGTTADVTAFTSAGNVRHSIVVLSNVNGQFVDGETVTDESSNSGIIQTSRFGLSGVVSNNFTTVKAITMAGSPPYTADTSLENQYSENLELTGTGSIANSGTTITGFQSLYTSELRNGDIIRFTTDAGTSLERVVKGIYDNNTIELESAIGAADVTTRAIITRLRTFVQGSNRNINIFNLPAQFVKTLKTASNNNQSDTSLTLRRNYVQTLSSDGRATITAGNNELFVSHNERDFTATIQSTGSGSSGTVGDTLSLSGNNHEGDAVFTLAGTPTGRSLGVDFGANFAGHTVKFVTTIVKTIAESKTKSINEEFDLAVTSQANIESVDRRIRLGVADVITINAVYMSANFSTAATSSDTNITSRFELDSGQRDNFYDIASLILKPGEPTPTGRLLVNLDYFDHGTGDFFDIDSYEAGGFTREEIPSYISTTTGTIFDLGDCLDFRPRVSDASTLISRSFEGTGSSTVDPIKFGSFITADLEFYLPRIDKIFLDKDGSFRVSSGGSGLNPTTPPDIDNAIHLYTLHVPAYTANLNEISIIPIDNRRYTMRDIGRIESRISTIEYYTQLSLLETQAQNLQIQDANGFDRFKNGYIVDNFTGHNIGDVGNVDYKVSMDMSRGEVRPPFNEDAVSLVESSSNGVRLANGDADAGTLINETDRTNYRRTGDLITLPYTETAIVTQPYASTTLNVNPFNVITWSGSVELINQTDEWKETERAPELIINRTGGFDTLARNLGNDALEGFEIGTIWNEWQDFWTGNPSDVSSRDTSGNLRAGNRVFRRTEVTTAQTVAQTRTGIRQTVVPETIQESIGDRVINIAFVPWIRARNVRFSATRLKPNTRLYPFFDGDDVSLYCRQDEGALGSAIVTDNNGAVSGTFEIPSPLDNDNPRWRTGSRTFRLTSSQNNDADNVETAAEGEYIARGTLETVQDTIISTREPVIVRNDTVTDTRNITRTSTREATRTVGWVDPLSQTFLIDTAGGVFLTSIDLFFQTKDDNIPITVQIREVVNGYPGSKIIPFSEKTLNPNQVNVSDNGNTSTRFTFNSPVYLQENVEYCFVVLSNSNNYRAYIGTLGQTVIGSNRTISEQPYAGVLFKSQNGSTWTADQQSDMKFTLNRASFDTSVNGSVTFVNDALPAKTLRQNPIRTTSGSNVVRVFHRNHGLHDTTDNVTIAGFQTGTNYNGIPGSELNGEKTSISNITLDSYDITVSTNATDSGDVGGTSITATQNRQYDVANINLQTLIVSECSINYTIRPTTGKSIHGTQTAYTTTNSANAIAVAVRDNLNFVNPQVIASRVNEVAEMNSARSFILSATLSSNRNNLSPVIDTQRASVYVINNRINSPTSSNTVDFVADTESTRASSSASYVTRPIVLENPSTALDIRLTANVPDEAELEVYYRVAGGDESRNLSRLTYVPFNTDGSEDTEIGAQANPETFREYQYTASDLADFNTFQIKIVFKGTNSSRVPRIRDLRGVALAI